MFAQRQMCVLWCFMVKWGQAACLVCSAAPQMLEGKKWIHGSLYNGDCLSFYECVSKSIIKKKELQTHKGRWWCLRSRWFYSAVIFQTHIFNILGFRCSVDISWEWSHKCLTLNLSLQKCSEQNGTG